MIVDAHAHYPAELEISIDPFTPMKTIELEKSYMMERGIQRAVMFAPLGDWVEGNTLLKTAVEKDPDWIIPFCTVNPLHEDIAIATLRKCVRDWGFKGLKMHPQVHAYPADSLPVMRVMDEIARLRVPVIFHTGDTGVGLSYAVPERYVKLAEAYPDVTIIMGHMGVSDWPEVVEMARRFDNLILDTTGSIINYGMVEKSVEVLGPERIVWGSDAPLEEPLLGISKVRDSDVSEDAKRLILGENILRIVKASG
jgi:predicted TIM-barrel fold metal-dependent hydrolase